ncbi:hypothetical protein Q765_15130 [Flavobacterium rivuli WB 3.3-2 = DSM 21788]|uniref:Uncharacterized protein n=2 Tax=Flavobacterium rivuli TaxID=498301 RepID=A0A0A2MB86_9FLAO|nr:hypothetical protein Q765_15130 [Flavobacterium rivuli WB 3.3-2 = DSM 21788]
MCNAQDTLIYSQKDASMFSNYYYLYPKTKTFEHKFSTDDMQIWYGYGTFTIKGNKIAFVFGESYDRHTQKRINQIYDTAKTSDTLQITFKDSASSPAFATLRYKDTFYYSDIESGNITIPKKIFEEDPNPSIAIYGFNKLELNNLAHLKEVEITMHDFFIRYHYESNFTRELIYKGNKLKSKDFYSTSRKRRVQFLLEKK